MLKRGRARPTRGRTRQLLVLVATALAVSVASDVYSLVWGGGSGGAGSTGGKPKPRPRNDCEKNKVRSPTPQLLRGRQEAIHRFSDFLKWYQMHKTFDWETTEDSNVDAVERELGKWLKGEIMGAQGWHWENTMVKEGKEMEVWNLSLPPPGEGPDVDGVLARVEARIRDELAAAQEVSRQLTGCCPVGSSEHTVCVCDRPGEEAWGNPGAPLSAAEVEAMVARMRAEAEAAGGEAEGVRLWTDPTAECQLRWKEQASERKYLGEYNLIEQRFNDVQKSLGHEMRAEVEGGRPPALLKLPPEKTHEAFMRDCFKAIKRERIRDEENKRLEGERQQISELALGVAAKMTAQERLHAKLKFRKHDGTMFNVPLPDLITVDWRGRMQGEKGFKSKELHPSKGVAVAVHQALKSEGGAGAGGGKDRRRELDRKAAGAVGAAAGGGARLRGSAAPGAQEALLPGGGGDLDS